MLNWIFNLYSFLAGIWSKIPEKTKEKIISIIVETFESWFRDFYRSWKRKKDKNNA